MCYPTHPRIRVGPREFIRKCNKKLRNEPEALPVKEARGNGDNEHIRVLAETKKTEVPLEIEPSRVTGAQYTPSCRLAPVGEVGTLIGSCGSECGRAAS